MNKKEKEVKLKKVTKTKGIKEEIIEKFEYSVDVKEDVDQKEMLKMLQKTANNSEKLLGAHVSAQGGPPNAILNAVNIGCKAFALFIRNQRRWESKPMTEDVIERWNKVIKSTQFPLDRIVPHGSYLLNAGSPDSKKLEMTRVAMLDECQRCERLGISLYNFHPGSSIGIGSKEQCLTRVADTINYIHGKTEFITLVVETMAGAGNTVGGNFDEIRVIIAQVNNKKRVGVCIDTCHIFAAGYDTRSKDSYEKVMKQFEKKIGFNFLKAVHLNDSAASLSSKLDRHQNIGEGYLGNTFRFLMNDPRFNNIPMILETPEGKYIKEMVKLYGMEKNLKK